MQGPFLRILGLEETFLREIVCRRFFGGHPALLRTSFYRLYSCTHFLLLACLGARPSCAGSF